MMNEEINQGQLLTRMSLKSLGAFLLSYCFLYYSSMYVGIVGASEFGISSVLHLNYVDYLISSRDWKIRSVVAAFGYPFLYLVVVGIISFGLFLLFIRFKYRQLAWFWSWLTLLSSFFIFGTLVAGISARKGIFFALSYFNYGFNIRDQDYVYLYLLPAVVGLTITSISCRRLFMELSPSVNLLVEQSNAKVLFRVMLLPAIVGLVIIGLSHAPENTVYETILYICILIPLVIATLSSNNIRSILIKRYPADAAYLIWIIAGITIIVAIRILLTDGMNFIVPNQ